MKETADKEEFKKLFRVFEKLEGRSSEYEFLNECFYRRLGRERVKVKKESVAES